MRREFLESAANWDLEANYLKKTKKERKKESTRLPIRTPNGIFVRPDDEDDAVSNSSEEEFTGSDGEGSGKDDGGPQRQPSPPKPSVPEHVQIREAQEELARIALLLNEEPEENPGAFKALAAVGTQYPSVAVQKLVLATQLAVYKDVIPGYRIRAPGADDADGSGGKMLSKEVRRLRTYETALVAGYQAYLKELARYARSGSGQGRQPGKGSGSQQQDQQQHGMSSVAISCACALVTAVPHFNFRTDLLRIVVGRLSRRPRRTATKDGNGGDDGADRNFDKCCEALETLFREDEEGRPSFEAVGLLAKMMRACDYEVDERVLDLFLHLRLLSEFSGTASADRVETSGTAGSGDGSKAVLSAKHPKSKKRDFRTKRERKHLKEQKALERDMALADALVSHEERERMQSETLKLVFATYFRVLKLRRPRLMGAVLEGLAKYAHLINQDFFGDLLEALKDLVRDTDMLLENSGDEDEDAQRAAKAAKASKTAGENQDTDGSGPPSTSLRNRDPAREALLCTVTAYALLAGQDAHAARGTLHLDLSFFTAHMYRDLLSLCLRGDLEDHSRLGDTPSASTTNPPNKKSTNRVVNYQTLSALLLRCLSALLLPRWQARALPPTLLAAFVKRIGTASLQTPERTTRALLTLLADIARVPGNKGKIGSLWHTEMRRGDAGLMGSASIFGPGGGGVGGPDGEGAVFGEQALATTVWEGEILRRHYCPAVREGVKVLESLVANMN